MTTKGYACFACNDLDMACQRCGRKIEAGEKMQARYPDDGNRWWSDKRCYPNCEEAALAASQRTVPVDFKDIIWRRKTVSFLSRYEETECTVCHGVIEIGERMNAEVCPLERPKFQNKRHRSCPCPPELLSGLREGQQDGAWSATRSPTVTCSRCLTVFSGAARQLCGKHYDGTICCSNCAFSPPLGSCSELEEEEEDSDEENNDGEKKEEQKKQEGIITDGDAPSTPLKRPGASNESIPSTPPRLLSELPSARTPVSPPTKKAKPDGENPLARDSKPVFLSMSASQPQAAENHTQGAENHPPETETSQAVRALSTSTPLAAGAAAEVETKDASVGTDDDAEIIRAVSVEEQIMQRQRKQGVIDVDEVSRNLAVAEGWTVPPTPESSDIDVGM